jgi:ribosomal protein S18 acetylase RimI-like enzyme
MGEGKKTVFNIRQVKMEDLPELVFIEKLCFLPDEAATMEAFEKRILTIPDSFFVAEKDGVIVGLVNGPVIDTPFITDGLFKEISSNPKSGGHQSILGLAVAPSFQKKGIASALLLHMENDAKMKNRESITLTCKDDLLSFYGRFGYINKGISTSEHGGVQWFNMVKLLL